MHLPNYSCSISPNVILNLCTQTQAHSALLFWMTYGHLMKEKLSRESGEVLSLPFPP